MATRSRAGGTKRKSGKGSARKGAVVGKRPASARKPRTKRTYSFGAGRAEGRASLQPLLGGKGANLAEMNRLGVPVPAGFTISTEVCGEFRRRGGRLPPDLRAEVVKQLSRIERTMGGRFGDAEEPLLLSVRSGARVSMPGMMDTVLNLGLNASTVEGLAGQTGDRRFAYDSYRRFIQMYGDVVLGIPKDLFEDRLASKKAACGVDLDTGLDVEALRALVEEFRAIVKDQTGKAFPERPVDQLWTAIAAVFESWQTPRAQTYRRLEGIPEEWGTAVNVQAMVFGNLGSDSATGVAFTRNPSTGERLFFGEFLPQAQGEDVVAGIRTPQPVARRDRKPEAEPSLEELMPDAYRKLIDTTKLLENHYRDMQDLEFTIQRGTLWMLQTRNGKRTGPAAVKIAVDMVRERLIEREEALGRVDPEQLNQCLLPTLDSEALPPSIASGLAASPGGATGAIVFTADAAVEAAARGENVLLLRRQTSPDDVHGMDAANGILTSLGGMTSHAAVVARGMGKCCITGCSDLDIDSERGIARLGEFEFKEGDVLSLDGTAGLVFKGEVPLIEPKLGREFGTLMKWADEFRRLEVRTNADNPADAEIARRFGARGIGLCRTEHMFFQTDRLLAVRRMILAETVAEREAALAPLLPMQRDDFVGIFRAMRGLPVTIRLLDPPLHEFLPHTAAEVHQLAAELGISDAELQRKVDALREFNPMLGHRGCRLAITYPEIYQMQVRAIFEAACACAREKIRVHPEVMLPLIATAEEFERLRALVEETAGTIMKAQGRRIRYQVGTMIEVPRAALTAGPIARLADFFSFGTNDLTQTTFALSRDDSGRFLGTYSEEGILPDDPFVTLDVDGVGALVRMGVEAGRKVRPELHVGICGEHGGDPRSIRFCEQTGFDYVSCSPYRVPIARLAAAQAAIDRERTGKRKRRR